jgi:hypothetical protein
MSDGWKSYEEVATYLLNQFAKEFNLDRVEPKQKVKGLRSGTEWTIDAKGVRNNNEGFVIVECRRYSLAKQNQEKIGGLAYRIIDTGAVGGIIVSPLGIQEGAAKIAAAEHISNVQLDIKSTPTEFSLQFLKKIMIGMEEKANATDSCSAELLRICRTCSKQFSPISDELLCSDCTKLATA